MTAPLTFFFKDDGKVPNFASQGCWITCHNGMRDAPNDAAGEKAKSHPLIGDVRYGKGEHNRLFRERFGLHRLALHALELAFEHPGTGEPIRIMAPLPEDLAGPLRKMGMDDHFLKIPTP